VWVFAADGLDPSLLTDAAALIKASPALLREEAYLRLFHAISEPSPSFPFCGSCLQRLTGQSCAFQKTIVALDPAGILLGAAEVIDV